MQLVQFSFSPNVVSFLFFSHVFFFSSFQNYNLIQSDNVSIAARALIQIQFNNDMFTRHIYIYAKAHRTYLYWEIELAPCATWRWLMLRFTMCWFSFQWKWFDSSLGREREKTKFDENCYRSLLCPGVNFRKTVRKQSKKWIEKYKTKQHKS